ncbi:hypothetical protein FRACYDRAFT_234921 [Fragilariopsis cylindrus CCMP1102]|uniref:Uncharacterized protein n=1 Tax=Fragilariopsis cylindrus CCMP1102 TaxID=635003 RepID=A0A1E7FTX1_9STRA|nr:hypothetical protein FRACYDRAFT_234921 [Fragilariopsis cylindrus CCMP1102]|eukprot:OEU21293.1 hypothetical protein FRACYDRAFT_234921 [Fragilariopsis cylindrus CCMP1102]
MNNNNYDKKNKRKHLLQELDDLYHIWGRVHAFRFMQYNADSYDVFFVIEAMTYLSLQTAKANRREKGRSHFNYKYQLLFLLAFLGTEGNGMFNSATMTALHVTIELYITLEEGAYKAASTYAPPSGAWSCVGKVEEHAWISVLKR